MSTDAIAKGSNIKAFCFDVFGTCVDWRKSVENELREAFEKAPKANPKPTEVEIADIAAEWRRSYYTFVHGLASDPNAKFKTVDEHHHDALIEILNSRGLEGVFSEAELRHLALAWHRLDSWPDTNEGLKILGERGYDTCTLSNGNVELLKDMQKHSGMVFTHTFSGEMFGTYKPNPKVYLGAAEKLSLKPDQIAMVAAHLGDLKAAKGCGLRTVYVERPQEELWDPEQARKDGYVDLWIDEGDDGFLALARALS